MVAKSKKIRVENNMPSGSMSFFTSDGKKKLLRQPGAFTTLSPDDIWHVFNTCKLIQSGYLFIDDKDMRVELGLEEDDGSIDVNALSLKDLKDLVLNSTVDELKEVLESDLSDGTKEKIANIARDEYKNNTFDAKKLSLIEKETGLIIEDDGEVVEEINDVKPNKKVKVKQKQ
jgi:hypothetical protein